MSFAKRMVRLRQKRRSNLSDIEKVGDPYATAADNIQYAPEVETQDIRLPRASSLYDSCMRMFVIGTKEMKSKKRWTGVTGKVTFGIGNAIHWWVQNKPDILGNRRRGWWKCLACGKVIGFGPPPTHRCKFCNAKPQAIEYKEHFMRVRGPDFWVTGHQDMFMSRDGMYRVTEIKTINGDKFKVLAAPLISHVWQVSTYMWGSQFDGAGPPVKVDPNIGYIMYVSKKHAGRNTMPIKMFVVEKEKAVIERIKIKLGAYRDGVNDYPGSLPDPIDECLRGDFENYRAKTCPCLRECRRLR